MTPELGTLAGLIADLEELCRTGNDLPDPPYWRELNTFDVLNLIREHKRAMYCVIENSRHVSDWPRSFGDKDPSHYAIAGGYIRWFDVVTGVDYDSWEFHFRAATRAKCEVWIERQVNGDD